MKRVLNREMFEKVAPLLGAEGREHFGRNKKQGRG